MNLHSGQLTVRVLTCRLILDRGTGPHGGGVRVVPFDLRKAKAWTRQRPNQPQRQQREKEIPPTRRGMKGTWRRWYQLRCFCRARPSFSLWLYKGQPYGHEHPPLFALSIHLISLSFDMDGCARMEFTFDCCLSSFPD
jgi:hypothetical protein